MDVNTDFAIRTFVHGAQLEWQVSPIAGVQRRMLDRIGGEVARATSIVRYQPGSRFSPHVHTGGEEFIVLFVLEGGFEERGERFRPLSWLHGPSGSTVHAVAGAQGARVWIKTGHLQFVQPPALA